MSFFIQHQQWKTENLLTVYVFVTESKVFGKTTKGKDKNVQTTEVHSAGGKDEVQQNVQNKGTDLIY